LAELAVLGVDSSDPRANLQSILFCWQGTTAQAGQHLQLLDSLHGRRYSKLQQLQVDKQESPQAKQKGSMGRYIGLITEWKKLRDCEVYIPT